MEILNRSFLVLSCFVLLIFPFPPSVALSACVPPVMIAGDSYSPTSIQNAYDYARSTLQLTDFTLRLAGEIFSENLFFNGGMVLLDGGYDCSFSTKNATSSIFGSVTINSGTVNFAEIKIVSTDRCDFDRDLDGFTALGSCLGSADDCNDNNVGVYPGASESCDGLDNDCNGQIDEGFIPTDSDGDGYYGPGSCGAVVDDCNDNAAAIHPAALDVPYDGIDQDCNGTDLTFAEDNYCIYCHIPLNSWTDLHASTTAPDSSCASCHAATVSNILPGHYGQTVRTAGNNMLVGAQIVCVSCHDQVSNFHSFGANIVWGKVVAGQPTITCDTCHENRASAHATGIAHDSRIIDGSCGVCHTSDTSVLGSPGTGSLSSAADVDSLHRSDCALCHNYRGTVLNAGTVRQLIVQGLNGTPVGCTDCHPAIHSVLTHPVAVGPNDLSYDAPGQLCSDCHIVATWAEIEAVEHNVASNGAGSCATCHNSPRQEVINVIALGINPTHCLDCHSDKNLTLHGNVDHVAFGYVLGGTTTCLACHDPGSEENAPVSVVHANNCSLCHTTVPNLQPGVPVGGGDCVACHTSSWEITHTTSTPDHNSLVQVATTDCAGCHSTPPPLTDAANPKIHNSCVSCHDSNGALISLAVGQDFTTGGNCVSCHTGNWRALHPGEPDHSAIVTVGTTSCGSCHDDTLISGAATTHTGCSSCHDTNTGTLISLAAGKSSPGDCTTCHTSDWSASHTTACLSCHDQAQDNLDSVPAGGRRAVAGEIPSGTTHSHFSNPTAVTNLDCRTCHDLGAHTNGFVKLLDADTGSLYIFQRAADLTADPDLSTFCMSCHDQDGARRLVEPMNPFGNGNSPHDTASRFLGSLEWTEYYGDQCFGSEGSGRFVNSHHDIADADQANSDSKLECLNCHSAHAAADTQPLADPFNALSSWTGGINAFCQACHNGGETVTSLNLPVGVAMGKIVDADGQLVNALGGMDSCSYHREPWWIDVRVTNTPHEGGSKRAWPGYSGAPAYVMECTACHDPHGSYSASNPMGNPYAIRDYVDGRLFVDDGAKSAGFNGPPWTTYGINQQVILTPTITPGSENLDLRNLCVTCHSAWEAAYSWHAYDCTGCLTCHSHGAAWGNNDYGGAPGDTPWCP